MTSRVSLLSSTAIAAAAIVLAGATASAASMDALEKRVKALEKAGAAQSVSRTKKTMKLAVSGFINRTVQFVDNGINSEFRHTTPNSSRSRVRWIATGKISDDVSARVYIELGNQEDISTGQTLATRASNGGTLDTRHFDLQIKSKAMGQLYMGHGSTAADGVMGANFDGTAAVIGSADESLLLAEPFFTSAGVATGITTRTAQTRIRANGGGGNLDGTRNDRLRYDTPSFGGFTAKVSASNDDRTALALNYGGSFSGVKVKAGIGWQNDPLLNAGAGVNGIDVVSGSIGVLLPMGLSASFAAGEQDQNTAGVNDGDIRHYRVGYKFKGVELGETRLAATYSTNEDMRNNGDEMEVISVAVVQIIEPLGAELYAAYNNWDLTQTGVTGIEDIDLVTVGMRVSF